MVIVGCGCLLVRRWSSGSPEWAPRGLPDGMARGEDGEVAPRGACGHHSLAAAAGSSASELGGRCETIPLMVAGRRTDRPRAVGRARPRWLRRRLSSRTDLDANARDKWVGRLQVGVQLAPVLVAFAALLLTEHSTNNQLKINAELLKINAE